MIPATRIPKLPKHKKIEITFLQTLYGTNVRSPYLIFIEIRYLLLLSFYEGKCLNASIDAPRNEGGMGCAKQGFPMTIRTSERPALRANSNFEILDVLKFRALRFGFSKNKDLLFLMMFCYKMVEHASSF